MRQIKETTLKQYSKSRLCDALFRKTKHRFKAERQEFSDLFSIYEYSNKDQLFVRCGIATKATLIDFILSFEG